MGWLMGLVIGIFGFIILMVILSGIEHSCSEQTYILKGINGITDADSGLLSSGDVSKTSLLMQDGTIITLNRRIDKIKLNEPITIRKCMMMNGGIEYKIKGGEKQC